MSAPVDNAIADAEQKGVVFTDLEKAYVRSLPVAEWNEILGGSASDIRAALDMGLAMQQDIMGQSGGSDVPSPSTMTTGGGGAGVSAILESTSTGTPIGSAGMGQSPETQNIPQDEGPMSTLGGGTGATTTDVEDAGIQNAFRELQKNMQLWTEGTMTDLTILFSDASKLSALLQHAVESRTVVEFPTGETSGVLYPLGGTAGSGITATHTGLSPPSGAVLGSLWGGTPRAFGSFAGGGSSGGSSYSSYSGTSAPYHTTTDVKHEANTMFPTDANRRALYIRMMRGSA